MMVEAAAHVHDPGEVDYDEVDPGRDP